MIVHNLGWHLLVSSAQTGLVAICTHPADLPGQLLVHSHLDGAKVPFAAPDFPVEVPILDLKEAKARAVSLGLQMSGGCRDAAAALLRISPRTLRHWAAR